MRVRGWWSYVGRARRALLAVAALALSLPWSGHALQPGLARAEPAPVPLIAFTRHYNVYLMRADGSHVVQLTSDGTAYGPVIYPWYAWSPDRDYLLLVRHRATATGTMEDLLVLNRSGALLRVLATYAATDAEFEPSWALDADQIAYIASQTTNSRATVNRVDLQGKSAPLWRFTGPVGCGASPGNPSESLYRWEKWGADVPPTLQWSAGGRFALFSNDCDNALLSLANFRTGTVQLFERQGSWGEAAISPDGSHLAAVEFTWAPFSSAVVIWDLRGTAKPHVIRNAMLPTWVPDGQSLYFVWRGAGRVLPFTSSGQPDPLPTYSSAIYSAKPDGAGIRRVLPAQDAYGFGPLHPTPDGRSLIFSRVDNMWDLWQHRLPDDSFTDALVQRFGPAVSIQRLDGTRLTTIARDAGRPQL